MTTIGLDASVAVKLLSEEPGSQAVVERGIDDAGDRAGLDALGVTHALWTKAHLSPSDTLTAIAAREAIAQMVDMFLPGAGFLPTASTRAYDLAQSENGLVLTGDLKFVLAAARGGHGAVVEHLA